MEGGSAGMTCVKSCQKPPLFMTISANSNTDFQLAKSESISAIGMTSVSAKIYFRLKKNLYTAAFEKGMRIWERNSSADNMVNKGGERGRAVGTGIDILLHCVMKIMVRQAVPCSPWSTPQCCNLQRAREAEGSQWELWPMKRSTCRTKNFDRTCWPCREPMLEPSAPEEQQSLGITHAGSVS